jgi:hypothetical protein
MDAESSSDFTKNNPILNESHFSSFKQVFSQNFVRSAIKEAQANQRLPLG